MKHFRFINYIQFLAIFLIVPVVLIGQPGSLDQTFGINGYAVIEMENIYNRANSMIIQPDGKIVLVGSSQQMIFDDFGADFTIVRLNVNGTLDYDFGNNGIIHTDLSASSSDVATDVAIQADGKIIAAGRSHSSNTYENYNVAIVRYNSDGTLDETFGSSGIVLTPIVSEDDYSYDVSLKIQPDGKILVAGSTINSNHDVFLIMRYDINGILDLSFGSDGKVLTTLGEHFDNNPNAIEIQTDGKILVGGVAVGPLAYQTWADFGLIRLNTDGTLDHNFGNNGIVLTPMLYGFNAEWIEDLKILNDGKIIAIGSTEEEIAIVRYNDDGSIDETFGNFGKVLTQVNSLRTQAYTASINEDQSIIVGGLLTDEEDEYADIVLIKYLSNGSIDNDFGEQGIVVTDINDIDAISCINVQPDGKIVASGFTGDYDHYNFLALKYNNGIVSGLENPQIPAFLSVYPNPAANELYIGNLVSNSEKIVFSVFDSSGKNVFRKFLSNSDKLNINIDHLQPGLYIAQIEFDNRIYKQKFIKK